MMPNIDSFSFIPLHLETYLQETKKKLKDATGFTVSINGKFYLITNWHVVSGRNPSTNEPTDIIHASVPDRLDVWFHSEIDSNMWYTYSLFLMNKKNDSPLWMEHSEGRSVDVVALSLPDKIDNIKYYPLDLSMANKQLFMHPAEEISIVGFPFGKGSFGEFPIWKTGHIASDVELDYDRKPVFLVDATVRDGMSGAPVIARKFNHPMITDTSQPIASSYVDRFLGIFSGGISNKYDTEIGMVWKPHIIAEIIMKSN